MPGLIESYASRRNWAILPRNVIVEGSSDAGFIMLADSLYHAKYGTALLGNELGILVAGQGDDGGVAAVTTQMITMHELARSDLDASGNVQYRFLGLYDNDDAGRRALQGACATNTRLRRCGELFLLKPVMPRSRGALPKTLEKRFEESNTDFKSLDWEMEDLLSATLLDAFEADYPTAVRRKTHRGGRCHRDFTRDGKHWLLKYAEINAMLEDVNEMVRLVLALRDYLNLAADHLVC